ncbi:phosphatidylinositol-specific phospholipase C, X domain protein (macronuclear) [Tetrahymena thermophila SB210]|uniref:Phosphoinositide phospholipase C n=2 Tax=Tetrahymena TaxID=5890 RepID=I7LTG4_TETTS|nr:phosphatidylinositol-specific phospholipase C, X domain protein [Tetrahymena thermophila SB210]EAR85196.2 phosphatidylinositol-specific phospholipase C, X domain protein [Tetrahymena thermophila SB210]|eukprot:XP_001032859.2 phosphatidylinositol-specific phospholipase C, X domain protein [Tetrahymena thermophila SB210]
MINFMTKTQDVNFKLEKFDDSILLDSINRLVYGTKAEKLFKQGQKKHSRIFFLLDDDYRFLQWISPQKNYTKSRIYLNDIKDISREIHYKVKNKNDQHFLRIQTHNYELVIQFFNEKERDQFQCGLQHFLIKAQHHEFLEKRQDQVKHLANILFISADKDGNKQLDLEEVKKLLQELHVSVNKKYLKQLFQTYDYNQNNQIDQGEFINIIRDISKKDELLTIFKQYCQSYNQQVSLDQEGLMTIEEYQLFLQEQQKQNVPIHELLELFRNINNVQINVIESAKTSKDLKISFYQFSNLIFTQENSVLDIKHQEVHQNMNLPLSDYFINSSHNTYLMANQLTGDSSCQAYINAFLRGCRCVELDCWDGENNEPLVYHGHTLTSRILFKDVLQTIEKYAFMTSPFPVILSFENHCSVEQSKKIAYYLKTIFKDKLFTVPKDYEKNIYFKSPNELKGKIIVKSKGKVEQVISQQEIHECHSSESDEEEGQSKTDIQLIDNQIIPDYSEIHQKTQKTQGKKVTIFMQKNKEEQTQILHEKMSRQGMSPCQSREQSFINNDHQKTNQNNHMKHPSNFQVLWEKQERNDDYHNVHKDEDNYSESSNIILRASKEQFTQRPNLISKHTYQVQKTNGDTQSIGEIPANVEQKGESLEKLINLSQLEIFNEKIKNGFAQKENNGEIAQQPQKKILNTNPDQISDTNIKEQSDKKNKKSKKQKPSKICKELLEITSMFGCKMDLKDVNRQCWYISSISEVKYLKLIKKCPGVLIQMFKKSFIRLYPGGMRVDSSNYDPIKGFLSGAQIVALNFQTPDLPMVFNLSKFQENGGIHSGYVLKPNYMLHHSKKDYIPTLMTKTVKVVRIQIISGQQLRPEDYEQDTFDVVDPYVQVFVKGTDFDENNNKPCVTDVVYDNGFHPIWNSHVFEFRFACPELAMIVFRVMDSDVGIDTQLGIYAISVDCMRPGYRMIPLRSKSNLELIDHSFILAKIEIEEIIQRYTIQ